MPIIPRPHWTKVVLVVQSNQHPPFMVMAGPLADALWERPAIQGEITRVAQGVQLKAVLREGDETVSVSVTPGV